MKSTVLAATSLFTLALAAPCFAQQTSSTTDAWRLPHQRGFWGHAGISFGRSELNISCPAATPCDTKDQGFRLYAGGRFNNAVGLELGLLNIGKFTVAGGDVDGWGADIALVAGVPIGSNSAIFGKLGVIYGRTEVSFAVPGILVAGKERGLGPRIGVGAQVGLTPNWALRGDWDRFHMKFPGSKEDVDTLMVGVQYTFR
ncbi:MAG TPA: porin family protein [Burkholderiales bacterium]|nr:porin family protein [Burkholderiales bacterium]